MSRDDYYRKKGQLSATVDALEQMLKVVESYKVLISNKTEGYVKAIVSQEPPFSHTQFYLKKWFRTFLGIKDEAMLLINGELIRGYHHKVHEKYIHSREQEQHYYNSSSSELLGLSSCCVDGLNYEIRMIETNYKKLMRGDEGDSINILGDRVRDVEIRVDSLCKYVDSFASTIQKEMRKRVQHVQSISIEIKHKSENLSVQFNKHLTSNADFVFTCQEARKGSRKEALYSAIEEPRNVVSMQNQQVPQTQITTTKFRAKKVVTDAEDIEYQEEMHRQRTEKQEMERRRAEQEAAKGPDFGFDFSIDAEKQQAGAFELMAVPIASRLSSEVVEAGSGSTGTATVPDVHIAPATLQPAMLDSALNVLRSSSVIKVKIVENNSSTLVDPTQLYKTKISGTNVVVFNHAVRGNIVQLYMSAAMNSSLNFAELKDFSSSSCGVPVEELLQDVSKQLWLGMPFSRTNAAVPAVLNLASFLCLPVSVSVNATKYVSGDVLPLPSQKDLAEKRYLVKTDDRSTTATYTSSIAKWLATFDQEEDFTTAKKQLFSMMPIVHCICDCLHARDTPLRLGDLAHLALAAADVLPSSDTQTEQRRATTCLDKLLQLADVQAGGGIQVSISESTLWGRSLPTLLAYASHMDAGAAGLSAVDLADVVACAALGGVDVPASTAPSRSKFRHLLSLDLRDNHILSYVDHPWELLLCRSLNAVEVEVEPAPLTEEPESEPMDLDAPFRDDAAHNLGIQPSTDLFARFAQLILLQSVNLRVLDLSGCARSEKQASLLGRGLAAALQAREGAGLEPLERVGLRGLQSYPAAVRELHEHLHTSLPPGTGQTEGRRFLGVTALDTAGQCFVI